MVETLQRMAPSSSHCCSCCDEHGVSTKLVSPEESERLAWMQVLVHVAQKLEMLHAAGWTHRDIKVCSKLHCMML